MNFIQQAYKGNRDWFFWLLTLFLVFIGWQFIGIIPLVLVAFKYSSGFTEFTKAAEANFTTLGINSNLFLFLIILSFAFGLLMLLISVKYIHKRSLKSLITSRAKIDWNRFKFAFISWGLVAVISIIIGIFLTPDNYVWNFRPVPFIILLLVSFLFLPLQTSFEEILFRGYLMQGIGAFTKNRWFPLLFTSIVFGLLHGANPEVEKLGYISMVFYIGTGVFYGITTLMDEGIELALGLHAANNIVAAFFITTDWTVFQTDALYIDTSEPSVGWEMFFPVLVLYPLLLFFFSKKYGWNNWIEKLTGIIEKPIENIENIGVK